MGVPSYMIAIVLFVAAGVAWWGLLTGLTGWSRARFRTDLWRLRDDLVDDLVLGHPEPSQGALDLLEAVRLCIGQSEHFTPLRVTSMYIFWKSAGSPVPDGKLDLKPRGRDDELREYKVRLASVCTRYLFTNSLFGWLTLVLPLAIFLAKALQRLRRDSADRPEMRPARDLAQRPIRVDLQAEAWASRSARDADTFASV